MMIPLIKSTLLAALLLVPTVAITAAPVPPESATPAHVHPDLHDSPHPPAADAAPAVRWKADEPLRAGMRRVRAATQTLARGAPGHLDADQSAATAAELKAAVASMFAQCKLAPAPDAALHPLLAQVLEASTEVSGGHHATALEALHEVLARYAVLFEDSGWSTSHAP